MIRIFVFVVITAIGSQCYGQVNAYTKGSAGAANAIAALSTGDPYGKLTSPYRCRVVDAKSYLSRKDTWYSPRGVPKNGIAIAMLARHSQLCSEAIKWAPNAVKEMGDRDDFMMVREGEKTRVIKTDVDFIAWENDVQIGDELTIHRFYRATPTPQWFTGKVSITTLPPEKKDIEVKK